MLHALILFAQEEVKQAPPDGGGGLFSNPIMPMLLIMVVFFFLIILPAQRREKKQREMVLANLKKNDEVVTHAGIIGIVTHIKDTGDEVTLKIDDNARMRVLKSSIARILSKEREEGKDAAASPGAGGSNTSIKPSN